MLRKSLAFAALLAGSALPSSLHAQAVATIGAGNTLVTVQAGTPGTALRSQAITGLAAGDVLLGLDARPAAPRTFYSTGASGQLYAINANTGTAVRIGAPITLPPGATAAGYDFNPVVDRLRVVTNNGANLRLDPNTGLVAGLDTNVAYAVGDVAAGVLPRVTGAAYTNNVVGATQTTLYVIDSGRGSLAIQGSLLGAPVSPNIGTLTTVGALGVNTSDRVGFDISAQGQALATLTDPTTGVTSLYSVNLSTGQATLVGALVGNTGYTGLSFSAAPTASFAASGNQVAVANAIDGFIGVPSVETTNFYNAFDALPNDAERQAALNQFTPGGYSLLPDLSMRTAEFQQFTTLRYLRDYRAGGTGVEGTAGVAAPGERKFGSFLVARGGTGKYRAAGDRPGVSYGESSVIGGMDLRFGEKSLIGVSGGYSRIDARLSPNAENSHFDNWFAGGYGTFGVGPAYVDLYGSYGEGTINLKRRVGFGNFDTAYQARTRSRTWVAGGAVGLSFNFAGVEVEPSAGLRYTDTKFRGFSEGQNFGAFTFGEERYKSVLSNVGLRLGGAFEVGTATVRPEVRGAWRREWKEDGARTINYGFGGVPNGNLAYVTTPLDRDYGTFGAGFTVSGPTSPLSFVVDWNADLIGDRQLHTITGGARLTF
ncbi:DUF4394 domain-containing protein [Sandaracinobacteroides saxicola]|uniref:DUF4394 domain-containing protein n=1 Tax=Sandaracinobacteroides saxicola TaxID=2759707 RepID=A0A7G5ILR7_9SPHN|nr:DUF4394 domain-containing protein [Sandaracinobacteroides saxicola]QMW24309.1 DUF4394 domain-containing protein [Sandaracinobacteroides saxicola]